jgi:hypothetical protein
MVTSAVMSVPAFVMKIFDPLTTQLPSRSSAVVRAGLRLRQAERGELSPGREVGKPALLLLVGAEEQDRHRPERGVRGDRDRHRRVDPRQLLDGKRIGERVAASPSVLLRNRDAHEPELGERLDDLVGKAMLPVELLRDGCDPLLGEVPNRLPQQLVVVREVEVH